VLHGWSAKWKSLKKITTKVPSRSKIQYYEIAPSCFLNIKMEKKRKAK
jgi:hypothetical protein